MSISNLMSRQNELVEVLFGQRVDPDDFEIRDDCKCAKHNQVFIETETPTGQPSGIRAKGKRFLHIANLKDKGWTKAIMVSELVAGDFRNELRNRRVETSRGTGILLPMDSIRKAVNTFVVWDTKGQLFRVKLYDAWGNPG